MYVRTNCTPSLFFQQQKQQQQQAMNLSKGCKRSAVNKPTSAPPKGMAPLPPKMTGAAMPSPSHSQPGTIDQKNRSLTVMIPRAKYQSQHGNLMLIDVPQSGHHNALQKSDVHHHQPNCGAESIGSTAEAKLLTYLDANPSTSKVGSSIESRSQPTHSLPYFFFDSQGLTRKQKQALVNKGFTTDDGMILHYPYHSVETGKQMAIKSVSVKHSIGIYICRCTRFGRF